jgi:signal transduction histidine kinase
LRYERLEKIKTMELTAHKIDFLTNISHELKTPLSLIIGPLGKMMEQVKNAPFKEQLTEVRHNAMKMGVTHSPIDGCRPPRDKRFWA